MDHNTLQTIRDNFTQELKDSESGKKTSLPFIIHSLSPSPLVKDDSLFQVLVLGGSICRNALLQKQGNDIAIKEKTSKIPPLFHTREQLLSFVFAELSPQVSTLVVNFAYPLSPIFESGKLDGILVSGSKENKFEELVGKKIGREIETYIFEKTKKKIQVSIANDTVCLLLSGLTLAPWSQLACGIIGTGLNFAIFLDKNTLANLESANFDNFPQNEEGKLIDLNSDKKGNALFEKEVSGAYLYKHFNLLLKKSGGEYPKLTSTSQLNDIAIKGDSKTSIIAQNILDRSADLVSCQISGITEFKQQDTTFIMEGSLFWKAHEYKKRIEKNLKLLSPSYKARFIEIEDSAIIGAAKLAS